MRKNFCAKGLLGALVLGGLLALGGCSDDNNPGGDGGGGLAFEWTSDISSGSPVLLLSDETYSVAYHAEGVESITLDNAPSGWQVSVDEEAGRIDVTAPSATAEAGKTYSLQLTVAGADNQSLTTESVDFYHVTFDDRGGTFVLNEGNMTTENGSLVYITPEGYVVDDAYKRVNGTELGNVTQDMCFHDGKIYIISQNGGTNAVGISFENDGMLVVADGRTLEKLEAFSNEELGQLDWPTHIAVTDGRHAYIRDNAGVWHLDMDDVSLTFVAGSEGAPKAQFAVVDGEVYFPLNGTIPGIYKIDQATDKAVKAGGYALVATPVMVNAILGIAPADDGNLWVVGTSSSDSGRQGQISLNKLDMAASKATQNLLSEQPDEAYNCCLAACGNTIYYANGTTIYRARFNPEAEKGDLVDEVLADISVLDDNAAMLYNGLGVNPVTGHVYINTLRGVGNFFTTNSIWEFDFDASLDTPVRRFDDYTRFPAGFYFNN